MPDNSPILNLPYILPAQAQKHVTHNEAIRLLDMIVQLAVTSRTLTVPPATPAIAERYIVGVGATGAWAGKDNQIAVWGTTGWVYVVPLAGWQAYVTAESAEAIFNGTAWAVLGVPTQLPLLGVNATADTTNRLTVSAPATLLNNAGAGHQVKVNKAAAGDTASLLFQTGFSGRAEMGLAGNDDFSVKVSANGSAFFTAMQADAANGTVTLPQPVRLGGQAADPASPVNGTLWLNTTSGEVKLRSAGATIVVGGGGVTDGDKGDVVVSSVGAVWTVDAGAITLGKMANLATSTLIGRVTAGTGVPEALTATQVRTLLNVANGATANSADAVLLARANHTGTQAASTITGLAAVATSGSAADLTAGVLPAARFDDTAHGSRAGGALHAAATASVAGFMSGADKTKLDGIAAGANVYSHPNHSGDVTSVGDGVTTIAPGAVTNAKMANMGVGTFKGRISGGTGVPENLTATQATSLLDPFTSGLKGLVPASGGGTTNFLRADGTWAAPTGGAAALGLGDWWESYRVSSALTTFGPFLGAAISTGVSNGTIPTSSALGHNPLGLFLRSSTTANSGYRFMTSSLTTMFFGGGVGYKSRFKFLWRAFTSNTVRIGFHDTANNTDAQDGAYFEVNGATIVCKTASSGTRTQGAASYTALVDAVYTFDVDVNDTATAARYRVYENLNPVAVLDETLSTNIPTTYARAFGAGLVATNSGTVAADIGIVYELGMGTISAFQRAMG